nr:hypothetical protein [Tanacetum cinerariifolium]
MNPHEKQQVVARDDKWVTFSKRVKISTTNIRLETIVPQKEETFQVVIDLIKNSTCFKAFTISTNVLEIFMQQFWTILDICPRVERLDFTDVPDDDIALTFLIDLGYKGPLYKHTNMFVDHMHQPWRTLAAIIKKCLSRKTARNDKLRKSRIDILKEKRSRRKNIPYPQFTKIIINHFLKQHKSLTNLNYQHYHTIKDDGIVSRLNFVRIGKDSQEYGLPIPEIMLTEVIKQSESYQMLIKYSTSQIPPKKSRGKAKSIKQTKAEEAEAARKVYATHSRIVTESVPESSKKSGGRHSKSKNKRLQILCKLLKKIRRQAEDNHVLEAQIKELVVNRGVPDEEKDITEENVILEWGDEQDSEHSDDDNDDVDKDDKDGDADDEGDDHISDAQDDDDEDVKTESDEEDIYKYKIPKADAEKTSIAKDDTKKIDNSTNPCMQTHLDGSVIVDFIVALRMFTRSLILKRRVEDLQLGVEGYQKKLNIIKPQKTFPEIEFKESYTPSYDPPGILYEDLNKQKRVLRADELYKFSDGTLKSVRDEIHQEYSTFVWITTLRCQRESGRLLTERDRVL